jgi:ribosomal-protein-alanine N-acetyltransferase
MTAPGPRARPAARALETGPRLLLRPITRGDGDELIALRRRSARFLAPWEPRRATGVTARAWFRQLARGARDGRHLKRLICARESGAIVGYIAVNEIVRGPAQSGFLGYWIGAPYARRGYMTEALGLMLRHAFGPAGLHRLEANIRPGNRPSLALVRRAGFRREGYSPGYLKIDGRWADHERWALRAEEWRARRAPARRAARRASPTTRRGR